MDAYTLSGVYSGRILQDPSGSMFIEFAVEPPPSPSAGPIPLNPFPSDYNDVIHGDDINREDSLSPIPLKPAGWKGKFWDRTEEQAALCDVLDQICHKKRLQQSRDVLRRMLKARPYYRTTENRILCAMEKIWKNHKKQHGASLNQLVAFCTGVKGYITSSEEYAQEAKNTLLFNDMDLWIGKSAYILNIKELLEELCPKIREFVVGGTDIEDIFYLIENKLELDLLTQFKAIPVFSPFEKVRVEDEDAYPPRTP